MKKTLLALLVLLLCLLSTTSLASKRNAFEFCDLYQSRLYSMRDELGEDATHGVLTSVLYSNSTMWALNSMSEENIYNVQLPVGIAQVSVPMFDIEEINATYYNFNSSEESNSKNLLRCVIMLSALEYSGEEDAQMKILYLVNKNNPSNAIVQSISIFMDHIVSFINNDVNMRKLEQSKQEILVYTGLYDYYLQYMCYEDQNYEVINLIAKSRE